MSANGPVAEAVPKPGASPHVGWWWLSFAGDDGWLGGCVVEGANVMAACERAWEIGCNPGGDVLGFSLDEKNAAVFPEALRGRLLQAAELDEAGLDLATIS